MRHFCTILATLFACLALNAAPARVALSGIVTDSESGEPLAGVVISVGEDYLWAVTGIDGTFTVSGIDPGKYVIKSSYLGYVDWSEELQISGSVEDYAISLQESSLALKEVVVTAQRSDAASTSHTLGRDALNHLQMSNMSDMAALLPGGKTINPDLTTQNSFSLRDGGASAGNAAFGTAVEVDGVRLGNNAGFGDMAGVDTRSVSVDNVESVEVITGVPSVEYGDLNSGVVKIHTKRGSSPLNVVFSVNPRTYQTSVSKGFDLGNDRGVINASGEWTRATNKLDSPYQSYTRREASIIYSNTFAKKLRLEAGITGNLGGMNTEDDPDAFSGEYTKVNDNVLRANTSLNWQVNKSWITSLKFDASANYNDNLSHAHKYSSSASQQPAPHSERQGYFLASRLPFTFFSDQIVDSKEMDFASSLKYTWVKKWNAVKSNLKAGIQWKANGNIGEGEYYEDSSLAAAGYRPRPYSDYPFMHNVSLYAEDALSLPTGGKTSLLVTAGLRLEQVFVKGTQYENMRTLSPRFNARWILGDHFTVRGGWGVTEKLPSFYILYPKQEYRDIQTFSFSHGDGSGSSYIYYTIPFQMEYNPELRWQRNRNSELGIDFRAGEWSVSVVGFYNVTSDPFRLNSSYYPFQYSILNVPSGYSVPENPLIKVDEQAGAVYMRGSDEEWWAPMNEKVKDRTFVKTTYQDNGDPIRRAGVELTVECPEIKPLRTSLRLDASYGYSHLEDRTESYYYKEGWSHTSLANRSYQYVGIYRNGDNKGKVTCGKISNNVDANLTAITHIPEARIIITCRLEMSLLKNSVNIPAGDKDRLLPVAYMDLDGQVNEFTEELASDPEFAQLILLPSNDYVFDIDGYSPYMSANISLTKEIGDKVSLSFFANNFTNSRPTVYSKATGVGAIFTPAFYYGLTCRLKF